MKKAITAITLVLIIGMILSVVDPPKYLVLKSGNKIRYSYNRANLPIPLPREFERWFDQRTISNHINTESLVEDSVEILSMRETLFHRMGLKILVFWDKGTEPHKYELFENSEGEIDFKNVPYWID